MSDSSLTSQAARGGMVTIAFQATKMLAMLVSIVVLARLLDPAEFGLFAMVVAIIGVAEIFRDFGLSMAALQASRISRQQQSNLFWLNLGIGALLTAVTFGASWPIGAFYGHDEVVAITQLMSLTFLINGASTQFKVVTNRRLQFVRLSLIDVGAYVVALAAAIFLAAVGWGVWALVAQQIAAAVISLVLAMSFARWRPALPRRTDMEGLIGFGSRIAVTQIVGYLTRNVDSIALGSVWGPSHLGFYDRGFQIVMMPINQVNAPLSRVIVPTLSRVRDDDQRFNAALRRAQFVTLYATAPAFGLLVAMGDILTRVVLGDGWGLTGTIVQILAIGAIFRALSQVCYWIYVTKGLASAQMKYFLVAQPALAIVILCGVPWGAIGVAIAYAAGLVLYWVNSLWWATRRAAVPAGPLFGDAVRAIVVFTLPAIVIAAGLSHVLGQEHAVLSLGMGLAGALAYWLALTLLSSRVRDDLRMIWRVLVRRRKTR